jgi:hypothetical protein
MEAVRSALVRLISLLLLGTSASYAASVEVDPAVHRLAHAVEESCLSQREQVLEQMRLAGPAYVASLSAFDLPAYCSCLRAGVLGKVTAKLVRSGTEADVSALMQEIGSTCAGNALQAAFAKNACHAIALSFDEPNRPNTKTTEEACNCFDTAFAGLTGTALYDAVTQTVHDIDDLKSEKRLQAFRPKSLLPQFRSCLSK